MGHEMSEAAKPKRAKAKKGRSHLEAGFVTLWQSMMRHLPAPEREFHFAKSIGRKWRFDFAWPADKVAVEIDGGIFMRGGHNRGVQFTEDCEKLNAAVVLGWRVLRYTTRDMEKRPVQAVEEVASLIQTRPPFVQLQIV